MPFCPECKSLVYPKAGKLECKKCGWDGEHRGEKRILTQKVTEKEIVVHDENSRTIETRGSTKTECPKCGHGDAWAEFRQTRKSDEPPTMFCECKECAHRWRQY